MLESSDLHHTFQTPFLKRNSVLQRLYMCKRKRDRASDCPNNLVNKKNIHSQYYELAEEKSSVPPSIKILGIFSM